VGIAVIAVIARDRRDLKGKSPTADWRMKADQPGQLPELPRLPNIAEIVKSSRFG